MVNGCVAVRGAPFDYDRWESFGNPGWGWDDLLPYFVRIENDLDFGAAAVSRDRRADRNPALASRRPGSRSTTRSWRPAASSALSSGPT